MKKLEFSKLILIISAFIGIIIVGFTLVMVAVTRDLTPLLYLIPSVAGEIATGTGFYYSKAKVENRIKLLKKYGVGSISDEVIIDKESTHEY